MQFDKLNIFSMAEAAKKIETTRPKLFQFLKDYNLIIDNRICPALVQKDYFVEERRNAWYGDFPKKYTVILVTEEGLDFIINFAKLVKHHKLWKK